MPVLIALLNELPFDQVGESEDTLTTLTGDNVQMERVGSDKDSRAARRRGLDRVVEQGREERGSKRSWPEAEQNNKRSAGHRYASWPLYPGNQPQRQSSLAVSGTAMADGRRGSSQRQRLRRAR